MSLKPGGLISWGGGGEGLITGILFSVHSLRANRRGRPRETWRRTINKEKEHLGFKSWGEAEVAGGGAYNWGEGGLITAILRYTLYSQLQSFEFNTSE